MPMTLSMHQYHVEEDTAYHYNDLFMGMVTQDTPAECAAACTAWTSSPPCVAWTWVPANAAGLPGESRLKSARGNGVQHVSGLVSGVLRGEQTARWWRQLAQ